MKIRYPGWDAKRGEHMRHLGNDALLPVIRSNIFISHSMAGLHPAFPSSILKKQRLRPAMTRLQVSAIRWGRSIPGWA
jgi:hypothetical protein